MKASEIAERGLIYLAMVGSTAHGLHLEGQDDRDEMGIAVEPPEDLIGLGHFESHVTRTQPDGVRSGPGDLDRAIYSARKFAALAAQGNPSILVLLYAPMLRCEPIGAEFVERLKPLVASKEAGPRFLGFLVAQRMKLTGERGGKRVKRPELEAAHGYDTKFAMHAIRLGLQGCEFMDTGRVSLPMPSPDREKVLAVRRGEVSFEDALAWINQLEAWLRDWTHLSKLPDNPDREAINRLLVDTYHRWWVR